MQRISGKNNFYNNLYKCKNKHNNKFNNMKRFFSFLLCVAVSVLMLAQQKVTGTVFDAHTGEPLIGVSVLELGTTNGIITDLDGNFSFDV